ncbi:hypothetical protein Slin15195_G049760 [Septoria linicola]|uniref:Uncharacterized protein n=1 Tax=Septoria linicola TaxID=215465 RepID=A0A9Q9ATD8_9PEZI|nr:hypothetical protein Slin14017_G053290 [Septoria linicola]USW51657.1 hypothetical protein Slin15195_G049760 [Septoria linicola]
MSPTAQYVSSRSTFPTADVDLQQVTGQTAFWSLLPLALNAMATSSPAAKWIFGSESLAEGSLVPHISSPVFAAADCTLDLASLMKMLFRSSNIGTAGPSSATTSPRDQIQVERVTVRLTLFLFGVLPQAIRLFGMRGIPVTQVLAVVFLAASVSRTLSICMSRWMGSNRNDWPEYFDRDPSHRMLARRTLLVFHAILCGVAWHQVAQQPYIHRSPSREDVKNACDWVYYTSFAVATAATCYWVLGLFFTQRRRFVRLPISPAVVIVLLWPWLDYPGHLLRAGDAKMQCEEEDICQAPELTYRQIVVSTVPLIIAAMLGSWSLTLLLVRGSRWISGGTVPVDEDDCERASPPTAPDTSAANAALEVAAAPTRGASKADDTAGLHGTVTVFLAFKDLENTHGRSEMYQKWILISHSFYNFRRTLPTAFVEAWNGHANDDTSKSETANSQTNEAPSQEVADHDSEQPTPKEPEVPRWKRMLMALALYSIMTIVQMFFFLFFATASLYDVGPVYRTGKRLARKFTMKEHWIAFAIFNLATAASYYFVAFNGVGTQNPAWTNVLNR